MSKRDDERHEKRVMDLDGDGDTEVNEYLIVAAVIMAAILIVFWLSVQVAVLVGFDWMPPLQGLIAAPAALVHLVQTPGAPSKAWPTEMRSDIPSAWIFYPVLIAGYIVAALSTLELVNMRRRRLNKDIKHAGTTGWATLEDLGTLVVKKRIRVVEKIFGPAPKAKGVVIALTQSIKPSSTDSMMAKLRFKVLGRLGLIDMGEHPIYLELQTHALVVAGSNSGKTAGLCTPVLLQFEGVAIATSVKYDLLQDTIEYRRQHGRVFVFDPMRVLTLREAGPCPVCGAPVEATDAVCGQCKGFAIQPQDLCGWTPLAGAEDFTEAQKTAMSLVKSSLSQKGGGGNMDFWINLSMLVLPTLLFIAANANQDMRRIQKWLKLLQEESMHTEVDNTLRWHYDNVSVELAPILAALQQQGVPKAILTERSAEQLQTWAQANDRPYPKHLAEELDRVGIKERDALVAIDNWTSFRGKESQTQNDIGSTLQSAMGCYEDRRVLQSAMSNDITPEALFNGERNTLYVVAPPNDQERLEPLFVALMQSLLDWIGKQPRPLEPSLMVVIDEAANVAALPKLPEYLATIRSQNVQILTSWQDFAQVQARYGDKKNTVLNNSPAKFVLPRMSDPDTLRYFQDITGETTEEQVSVSRAEKKGKRGGGDSGRNLSISESRHMLLTAKVIREQPVGEAILVYGSQPPAKVKLKMFFSDPVLKELAVGRQPPKTEIGLIPRLKNYHADRRQRKRAISTAEEATNALPPSEG